MEGGKMGWFKQQFTRIVLFFFSMFLVLHVSCEKRWPQVCVDPFEMIQSGPLEASIETGYKEYLVRFPYHVVGTYFNGADDGPSYGMPEAVEGVYQQPGTEFPLNVLAIPAEAAWTGSIIELGPGSGVSLEGFLWLDLPHLEFNWDFPREWEGTFLEELCNHACPSGHEGDVNCGLNWAGKYAFSEDQLQGEVEIREFGTDPGDSVDIDILAVGGMIDLVDLSEDYVDCCAGLHISLKGTVNEEGRVILDEYCTDPRGGSSCEMSRISDGPGANISLYLRCASGSSSLQEQRDACWNDALGIEEY
jgi:hypothetical protein